MTQPDATFSLPDSRMFRFHGGPRNGEIHSVPETLQRVFFPRWTQPASLFRRDDPFVEPECDEYVGTFGGRGPYVWKPMLDRP